MDNRVAEAREIDWLVEIGFESFSAIKDGGTEAAKRRMRRDVVLQAEEVVHLVVGIPTINPVPFFGMSPKGDRIKSALAVSASPDAKAAINTVYFNAFIYNAFC